MSNVGIVIVSHSPLVAEGAADMVRQMVGDEVPLAWCGGDPQGALSISPENPTLDVEYGVALISAAKAEALVRRARALVDPATRVVRLNG